MKVKSFITLESVYGTFIVNRYCAYQAEALVKTGRTHIENELSKILALLSALPSGAVAIDAGANIGLVSIPMAQSLAKKNGHVLAFEPQTHLFRALCGATVLNDIENLEIYNTGLGRISEKRKLPKQDYSVPKDFGTVRLEALNYTGDAHEVTITSIDALNLQRLDFLKIDVEGMEIEIIDGGKSTISKYHPICWIEYWLIDKDKLHEKMHSLGYDLYIMDELNMLCITDDTRIKYGLKISAPKL
jgi:FkbM family methyltransferase